MSYRQIKNLKQAVHDILKENASTRNSDITLMIEVWKKHFPSLIKRGQNGEEGVWLKDLYDLPREDNIKRVRAFWQNDKKLFLPTEEAVAKARGINMDEWRVAMGYPTKSTAGTEHPSWNPPSEIKKQEQSTLFNP